MVDVVNDRDLILLGTDPRFTNTSVAVLASPSSNFLKLKNGGLITPTDITLTALPSPSIFELAGPSFLWEYEVSSDPNVWNTLSGSTDTQIIANDDSYVLDLEQGDILRFKVTATKLGFSIATLPTPFEITYSKEVDDATVPNISRPASVVLSNIGGTVTSNPIPNTGTTITVKRGDTNLTYDTYSTLPGTPNSYSIGTPTIDPAGAITLGTNTLGVFANSTAMAQAHDFVTVTYPITTLDAQGFNPVSYNVTQTFTKIRDNSSNTVYIFIRSHGQPATPTEVDPTTPSDPQLDDLWYDTPPPADAGIPLWASIAKKSASGELLETWSEPVQLEGGALTVEYSVDGLGSWVSTFESGVHFWAQYSYDNGTTWIGPVKIAAEDGGGGGDYRLMIQVYLAADYTPMAPEGGSYTFTGNVFVNPGLGDDSPPGSGGTEWTRDLQVEPGWPTYMSQYFFSTTTPDISIEVPPSSGGSDGTISLVTFFEPSATGDTISIPTHEANDFIIVFARSTSSSTVPSTPIGWDTAISVNPGTGNRAFKVAHIFDISNTWTEVTFTNADQLFGLIYRGVSSVVDPSTTSQTSGEALSIPSLYSTVNDTSIILAGITFDENKDPTDPTDHTRLWDNIYPDLGGGYLQIWSQTGPSSGGYNDYNGPEITWTGTANAITWCLELEAAPPTAAGGWSEPVKIRQDGINSARLTLYKRSATLGPTGPTGTLEYTFSSETYNWISSGSNGWVTTPPTGTDPLYFITASANSLNTYDSVYDYDWSDPVRISGTDAYIHSLSKEFVILPVNPNGSVSSWASASTVYSVIQGAVDDTANWSYSHTDTNLVVVQSGTNNNIFNATGFTSGDTGYFEVTASKSDEVSIVKRFTVNKGTTTVVVSASIYPAVLAIPSTLDGIPTDYSSANSTIYVLVDGADDSSAWTYTTTASSGITISGANTRNIGITSIGDSIDNGYVTIAVSKAGYTTENLRLDVIKNKSGVVSGIRSGGSYGAINVIGNYVSIKFLRNGETQIKRSAGGPYINIGSWSGLIQTTIGDNYWIRVLNSGDAFTSGAAVSTYLHLDTDREFIFESVTLGTYVMDLKVYITTDDIGSNGVIGFGLLELEVPPIITASDSTVQNSSCTTDEVEVII